MQRKKAIDRRFRSGEAAKLLGMPTATLRIWEQRYGAISPQTSTSGQRLFSDLDIERLRLLRRLVQRGHAIRSVAKMNNTALLALLEVSPCRESQKHSEERPGAVSVTTSPPDLQPHSQSFGATWEPLKAIHRMERGLSSSTLMIHVTELKEEIVAGTLRAAREMEALAIVIVYQSANDAAIERATRQNIQLVSTSDARTASESTLLESVRATNERRNGSNAVQVRKRRRFDDMKIASIAQMTSKIACDCPKHVAELIRQLTAFERYSDDCLSRTPTDALLHRRLGDAANHATSIFEAALADVMEHEGWN